MKVIVQRCSNAKCVVDNNGYALYFSRSKIPFERNYGIATFYGHLGIYGYKREALMKMTSLEQTPLERTESLEQLRALENGMKIKTSVVDFVPVGIGVGIHYYNEAPSTLTKAQSNTYNSYISNNTRTSHVGFEARVLF